MIWYFINYWAICWSFVLAGFMYVTSRGDTAVLKAHNGSLLSVVLTSFIMAPLAPFVAVQVVYDYFSAK